MAHFALRLPFYRVTGVMICMYVNIKKNISVISGFDTIIYVIFYKTTLFILEGLILDIEFLIVKLNAVVYYLFPLFDAGNIRT